MNEREFIEKWESDKPAYEKWGNYVVESICCELKKTGKNLDTFLKIPVSIRLKDDTSLLDKAFYRRKGSVSYNAIEDKVGARFVVLLLEDIDAIREVIKKHDAWVFDECKHFADEKEKEPLLFTYQSVHYILKPKNSTAESIGIPIHIPCELQIRTLLQHAHAELTHDAIYKAKRTVKPKVHRNVAKSMALIETTDEYFAWVTKELNCGPLQEHGVVEKLDDLYFNLTGLKSCPQKSSIVIWDEYEQFINEKLFDEIKNLLTQSSYSHLSDSIKKKYRENIFYQQSIALFIYWMLEKKKQRLLNNWPFERELLGPLADDLGVSIGGE